MKKIVFALSMLIVMASACSNADKEAQQKLYDEVMAVHDEIMPYMKDIMSLKKKAISKIADLEDADTVQLKALEDAISNLDASHEGMMDWMRGFDRNFEGKTQEEILSYLQEQKLKISDVGEKTRQAMDQAKKLIEE